MTANATTPHQPTPPRVSFRDLCALFCCPPLPSAIVSKLAFMPPEPSYRIIESDNSATSLQLIEGRVDWPHGVDELRHIDVFYASTPKRHFWSSKRNRIACMFVSPCGLQAHFTLLYSHANAVDLGQMCSFYYGLGYTLGCNVFSFDYSGYGCSTGRPTERNIYVDIRTALAALQSRYQIPPEKVILYGHSIGTVPSVDLASAEPKIAALILHSPLMSGIRFAFPDTQRTWCCDAFPSIEKIPRVQCPTLVIHGTDDDVIDFSHGVSIYDRCPSSVEPLWVRGAGHNDIELHPAYLDRLRSFIDTEVPRKSASNPDALTRQMIVAMAVTRDNKSAAAGNAAAAETSSPAAGAKKRSLASSSSGVPVNMSPSPPSRTHDGGPVVRRVMAQPHAGHADADIAILMDSGGGHIEGEKSTTLSWLRNKLRSDSSTSSG